MTIIQERLSTLGLVLPEATKPRGNYVSINIRGNIACIAIQFPKLGDSWIYKGRLGEDLTTEDGYKAAQLCGLNVLSHIDQSIGVERLIGFNHMDAYFQAGKDWDESPKIVDGASDFL